MVEYPDPLRLGEKGKFSLDPFSNQASFSDFEQRLINDFQLRDIGAACTGNPYHAANFAYILTQPLTSKKAIEEQQETIRELSQNEKTLNTVIEQLESLDEGAQNWSKAGPYMRIPHRIRLALDLLKVYEQTLETLYTSFSNSQSKPLQDVSRYGYELKNSPDNQFLSNVADVGQQQRAINIRATYDAGGNVTDIKLQKPEFNTPLKEMLTHVIQRVKQGSITLGGSKRSIMLALENLLVNHGEEINQVLSLYPDFSFYKAALYFEQQLSSMKIPFCVPSFSQSESYLEGMRHPYYAVTGKAEVPTNYSADTKKRVSLITGANDSGKSFFSKVRGINQLFFQRGMSVPAKEARLRVADNVYTHFLDRDDAIKGIGLFHADLERMGQILDSCSPRSLILVDEPCRGTEGKAGEQKTFEFLEGFVETGAEVLFNTHHHGVADRASSLEAVSLLHTKTELTQERQVVYHRTMESGPAGTSMALEFADSIGFSHEEILKRARKAKKRK